MYILKSDNWEIEVLVVENDDPDVRPEVRTISYRRINPTDEGSLELLKEFIASLPDDFTLREVMRSPVWGLYVTTSGQTRRSLAVKGFYSLIRSGFTTMGEVRKDLKRTKLVYLRNIGPGSAEFLSDLFQLPEK